MKQKSSNTNGFILIGLFLLVLLFHSTIPTATRHLLSSHYQGNGDVKANNDQTISSHADSLTEIKDERDFYKLMGFEEVCEEVDEECLSRRMIAEAHLDYIYTQSHHGNQKTTATPP